MLRKLKIPVIILVIVLLNQAAGYAVHAAMPDSLRPAGTTRYAAAGTLTSASTNSTEWADLPGLSQSISIPTGKRGDVFIFYCGSGYTGTADVDTYVRAILGGSVATPSYAVLDSNGSETRSRCANFYKLNVPAGTRTVRMQWSVEDESATHYVTGRNMIVIVNIHD